MTFLLAWGRFLLVNQQEWFLWFLIEVSCTEPRGFREDFLTVWPIISLLRDISSHARRNKVWDQDVFRQLIWHPQLVVRRFPQQLRCLPSNSWKWESKKPTLKVKLQMQSFQMQAKTFPNSTLNYTLLGYCNSPYDHHERITENLC